MSDEKKKAETKAKLKAFLQGGHPDDVQSVLVHTLMEHADKQAEPEKKSAKKSKPKKK